LTRISIVVKTCTLCATLVLMCEIAETAIKNVGLEALAGWSRGFSRLELMP